MRPSRAGFWFWLTSFVAYVVILLGCASTTASHEVRASAGVSPDGGTVQVWREVSADFHTDSDLPAEFRVDLDGAARDWLDFSEGNVRFRFFYDLDFSSVTNLKEHEAAQHNLLIPVVEGMRLTEELDRQLGGNGKTVLGATVHGPMRGTIIFLVLDRLRPGRLRSVTAHELGHSIGLPDLEAFGAIMSGSDVAGTPPAVRFTDADRALCRKFRYCL